MQEHYTQEIDRLKTNMIKMASLVDDQAERVFKALETGNIELCRGVKEKDLEIDAYDNLITTQCENIIALFQPVAVDLRLVMSALMINNQLERCGDISVNISQRVKKTSAFHSLITESGIVEMGQKARIMLKNSIDSFIQNNSELAGEVILNDDAVDKLNKHCYNYLVSKMQSDNSLIEPCTHLIVLTRNIERLADHATNIAENLVFYVEARIIAHRRKHPKPPEE
jgi:phosphate transport system protein